MMKIVHIPNKVLSTPSKPVEKIDSKIKKLVKEMEETLLAQRDPEGVGLAAPQVGVGLTIFNMKPSRDDEITTYINPKILQIEEKPEPPKKKKKDEYEPMEGCLSIPRLWSPVKRPQKVQLEYLTVAGEKKTEWFEDFEAVIVQHEVDHLNGILFTARSVEQKAPIYEEHEDELRKIKF